MSSPRSRFGSERGMALVGVMLMLILATGVCAALAVSGRTETMAAYNLDTSAQARSAAEAGLTAGAQAVISYLNTTPLTTTAAMNVILAGPDGNTATTGDNGSLYSISGAVTGLPAPGFSLGLGSVSGVSYQVQALDDDNWATRGTTPLAGSTVAIGEDGSVTNDANEKLVIRSVGTGRNNTTVTLEGIIDRAELGGILTGGDLKIHGNVTVQGTKGSVHTNNDLVFDGNPAISGVASATGTISGSPVGAQAVLAGQPSIDIPPVNAEDFKNNADWILTAAGMVQTQVGGVITDWCDAASVNCTAAASGGVSYSGGTWTIKAAASNRYYVEGPVESGATFTATIYATGDIHMNNNDDITAAANAKGIALLSNGNIHLDGGADVTGGIFARELIDFQGNHTILGQVVAENRSNIGVNELNDFGGNITITWNGGGNFGSFSVSSWREIK